MKILRILKAAIAATILTAFCACASFGRSEDHLLRTDSSQVKLRSIQTRAFDINDKNMMLRTIITTLQDFDYVLDKADATLGVVSATKLDKYSYRISVTVRPRGETQLLVRANIVFKQKAVKDPAIYQDFFTSLAKSMFLTAHEVD